jgi:hypothetical protein
MSRKRVIAILMKTSSTRVVPIIVYRGQRRSQRAFSHFAAARAYLHFTNSHLFRFHIFIRLRNGRQDDNPSRRLGVVCMESGLLLLAVDHILFFFHTFPTFLGAYSPFIPLPALTPS